MLPCGGNKNLLGWGRGHEIAKSRCHDINKKSRNREHNLAISRYYEINSIGQGPTRLHDITLCLYYDIVICSFRGLIYCSINKSNASAENIRRQHPFGKLHFHTRAHRVGNADFLMFSACLWEAVNVYNCFGGGSPLRFWCDLGTILGLVLRPFWKQP